MDALLRPGDHVFISSTMVDLGPFRRAAQRALSGVGLVAVRLEQLWQRMPPVSARTPALMEAIAGEVRACAAMLVILGGRTGARVAGGSTTFTERELETAVASRLPVFLFVTPGSSPFRRLEGGTANAPDVAERLRRFRSAHRVERPEDLEQTAIRVFRAAMAQSHPLECVVLPPIDPALVARLLADPSELAQVSDRRFEELVAQLLEGDGWTVDLVKRPNAPGPDIIACSRRFVKNIPLQMIVECKRYRPDRSVGVREVRNLAYWVDQEYQATLGLLATTSRFSNEAHALALERHRFRLSLRDSADIIEWLRQVKGRES
jgi:hypothetical protein